MRTKKNGNDFIKYLMKYLMDDEEDVEDHETDLQFLSLVASHVLYC
jgi:hypothetical protein